MGDILTVYLAGPMDGVTRFEAKAWRALCWSSLTRQRLVPLCPMQNGVKDVHLKRMTKALANEVFTTDTGLIDRADALIVNGGGGEEPMVGTSMEILYAWQHQKPVIVFNYEGNSAFMRHCATIKVDTALHAVDCAVGMQRPDLKKNALYTRMQDWIWPDRDAVIDFNVLYRDWNNLEHPLKERDGI